MLPFLNLQVLILSYQKVLLPTNLVDTNVCTINVSKLVLLSSINCLPMLNSLSEATIKLLLLVSREQQ